MVPGNPGNDGFYERFGRQLLNNLIKKKEEEKYVFLTLSHVNHVKRSNNPKNGESYKLQFQVDHKYNFINEFLSKDNELILIGHSIGSYMILKVLPQLIESGYNPSLVFGLFPTIERMSDTPNGQRLYPILKCLDNYPYLTKCITIWFDIMPIAFKKFLINCNYGFSDNIDKCIINSASELFNSTVIKNIIHMSRDELDNVLQYDLDLKPYSKKIYLYYGLKDGWVPLCYGEDMRKRKEIDDDHIIYDDTNSEHAFVIKESNIIADKLIDFL
uniref:Lipid droplet-associated hydrolase n=1 Tax=Parastrongyloides trichosuri TaxID=131310 RepID=A0A0N4ZP62_PARTI